MVNRLMYNFNKFLARICRENRGMTLVELLIALTIMGFTVVFVGGLFTGFKVLPLDQDAISAEAIARSQMEYTMSENYTDDATSYPKMPDSNIPSGYFIDNPDAIKIDPNNIGATPVSDLGIQRITVSVYRGDSGEGTPLLTLVGYKIKKWTE